MAVVWVVAFYMHALHTSWDLQGIGWPGSSLQPTYVPAVKAFCLVSYNMIGKAKGRGTYSIHAFKRSAIKRSAKAATQLLFLIHIVIFKRRIAVSGA